MRRPRALRDAPARPRAWTALVAGVGALSAAGVATAVVTMAGGGEDATPPRVATGGTYALAGAVPASFGAVTVTSVTRLKGLSHRQLSGVTHFPSYIGPDKVQLQAHVELSNMHESKAFAFTPGMFRLRVGKGALQRPKSANFAPGLLQPLATLRGDVIFVVPRRNARMTIEIAEPGVSGPNPVIDLGRLATPREATVDALGHDHITRVRNR